MSNHVQTHSKNTQQQQQQQQSVASKQVGAHAAGQTSESAGTAQVQRKLFTFFYIYAILIISLYVTYAAYYFYQHQLKRQLQAQEELSLDASAGQRALAEPLEAPDQVNQAPAAKQVRLRDEMEAKFESKLHLLERYIDMIAFDLQETKLKLREREKCDCALSCTFNNTRYADRSSWQNQCDTCTCQSGRISCAPRKCPSVSCDEPVQAAGQCCPVCMKKCKHNNTFIKHGHIITPTQTNSTSAKECKCHDGLIKCEQVRRSLASKLSNKATPSKDRAKVGAQMAPVSGGSSGEQMQAHPADANR